MATHSSTLAWRILGTEGPGGRAAVYGVAQGQAELERLSSSSATWKARWTKDNGLSESERRSVLSDSATPWTV